MKEALLPGFGQCEKGLFIDWPRCGVIVVVRHCVGSYFCGEVMWKGSRVLNRRAAVMKLFNC